MSRPRVLKRAVRIVLFLMPLAVLGNLIYTGLTSGDTGFSAIVNIPIEWLFLALLLSLAPWLVAIVRLQVWNKFFSLNLTYREIAEIVLANDVAAAVTPTAVGGGYAKAALLIYRRVSPGRAASLMIIGSLEEYLAMAITVPVLWMLYPPANVNLAALLQKFLPSFSNWPVSLPAALALVGAVTILIWAIPATRSAVLRIVGKPWLQRRVFKPLLKAGRDFRSAFALVSNGGKSLFLLNILLAGIQWAMRYSVFTAMAYGLGLNPHPAKFYLLQWVVFTMMNLIPTPGAIGGAEVVFALVFKGIIPRDLLIVSVGAWRFIATYLQLMIGAAIMLFLEKPALRKGKSSPLVLESGAQSPPENGKLTDEVPLVVEAKKDFGIR